MKNMLYVPAASAALFVLASCLLPIPPVQVLIAIVCYALSLVLIFGDSEQTYDQGDWHYSLTIVLCLVPFVFAIIASINKWEQI
jgi:hypothetical protein